MNRVFAVLIRHGQFERPEGVPSAHSPHPLTDEGRQNAREAAAAVLGHAQDFDAVIEPVIECSPLLRAWESASLLAEGLAERTAEAYSLAQEPALMERSLGSAANLTTGEIEAVVERDPRLPQLPSGWRRAPHFRLPLPGAESQMQAGARAAAHIEAALDGCGAAGQNTMKLFVAHGGCLRHAAVHLGVLDEGGVARVSMEYADPVVLEREGEGRFRQVGGQWKKRLQDAGGAG